MLMSAPVNWMTYDMSGFLFLIENNVLYADCNAEILALLLTL